MTIEVDEFTDMARVNAFVCPRCKKSTYLNFAGGYYERGSLTHIYQCDNYYGRGYCGYRVGVKEPDPDIVWASPNGKWAVQTMDQPRYYEASVMITDGYGSWYADIDDKRDIIWDEGAIYEVPKYARDAAASVLYGIYDQNSKRTGRGKPIRYAVIARDGVIEHEDYPQFFADYDKADKYAASLFASIEPPYDVNGRRKFVQIGRLDDVYYDASEIPPRFGYAIMRQYDESQPPKKKTRKGKSLSILKRR